MEDEGDKESLLEDPQLPEEEMAPIETVSPSIANPPSAKSPKRKTRRRAVGASKAKSEQSEPQAGRSQEGIEHEEQGKSGEFRIHKIYFGH